MATIYTSDSLRNIFQSSFNLTQWYSFSQHFFNASELKEKPERIIENTSDEGYYLGNINTTDSYRIGLFHYNIRQGSVANKRVGLRNLVKSFTKVSHPLKHQLFSFSFVCLPPYPLTVNTCLTEVMQTIHILRPIFPTLQPLQGFCSSLCRFR